MQPRMQLACRAVKTYCWIMSPMRTPAPFHRAFPNEFSQCSCLGLARPRKCTLHLALLSLVGPFLKFVCVPLEGIPTFCFISSASQLHAICRLALNFTFHITDKDIKEHWSQNKALRLITDLHLDTETLNIALCLDPDSQLQSMLPIHVSSIWRLCG